MPFNKAEFIKNELNQVKLRAFSEKQVYLHLCEKCQFYIALNDKYCQFCQKENEFYEPNPNVEPEFEVNIRESIRMIYERAHQLENETKMRLQPVADEKVTEPIIDVKHEDS